MKRVGPWPKLAKLWSQCSYAATSGKYICSVQSAVCACCKSWFVTSRQCYVGGGELLHDILCKDPRDSSVQEGKVESYSFYKPQSHHHAS